ncbi:NYN domain-containing protein [Lutibacter sp. B2]|nr:NYN domain-containing protein [Lutibacter sp. B2]
MYRERILDKYNENKERKMAVLIDGENAQPPLIEKMLLETEKYGTITIKRIYGDWTTCNMNGWKSATHNYAVQPIQQFRYTVGKNATDSALIIDAMDILHKKSVDSFCIVSSDSDYTRLATRIREEGIFVMGIGEKKTPKAFVNACDIFIYTEDIYQKRKNNIKRVQTKNKIVRKPFDAVNVLKEAFDMVVKEDGWAHLGSIGKALLKIDPDFNPNTYGYKQLSQLIKSNPRAFALRSITEMGPSGIYVQVKENIIKTANIG